MGGNDFGLLKYWALKYGVWKDAEPANWKVGVPADRNVSAPWKVGVPADRNVSAPVIVGAPWKVGVP